MRTRIAVIVQVSPKAPTNVTFEPMIFSDVFKNESDFCSWFEQRN